MENIWLDDERPEPQGWVRAKTATECIELLRTTECNTLSLDHDLGDCELYGIDTNGTGYDVISWIEEQVFTNESYVAPKEILIHTANPSARRKMELALKSILNKLGRTD